MTEHVDNHGGAPGKKDCGCGCNGSGDCGDKGDKSVQAVRRRLLTGMPVVLTFVSNRVLAGSKKMVCTPSVIASANASSGPEVGQNCAVSPGCWKNLAASDGLWQSTGSQNNGRKGGGQWQLGDKFSTAFGLPVNGWSVTGSDTLLDALNGNMNVQWSDKNNSNSPFVVSGNGFAANIVAALLNASAFGPSGHFPAYTDGAAVIADVKTLWVKFATPATVTQSNIDAATTGSAVFAKITSSQNPSLDQCFQGL